MRKIMFLTILALVFCFTFVIAGNVNGPKTENHVLLTGDEPLEGVAIPWNPDLITDSPGIVVGTTEYDYQTNGSTGNRAVTDAQGGTHFVWMKGTGGSFPPDQRAVYFNYVDNMGNWLVPEEGQNISQVDGDGYTQISQTNDSRASVAYHSSGSNFLIYAQDNFPGMGIFSYFDPPDMLAARCYWPYLTVDRNNNIHIVGCENTDTEQAIGYTRSTDGGDTWSRMQPVDTLMVISQNVVSSPVSDKVAIVYSHPREYGNQWYNDIYYVESEDGLTWDWRNDKVNVTDYGSGEETFWAYTDLAAVYDYNDNLNIIWNALEVSGDTLYYPVHLIHYSTGSGMMTSIVTSPEEWPDAGCETGAWNLQIAKMSLAAHEATNAIFAVYTSFDPEDCSAGGFANGDIHMSYSIDGGAGWSADTNLTDSQTPGCSAGDCDSDHWSSVADRVDSNLHIFYVNDKDAGGIPQTEGSVTVNPVRYLAVPNPAPTGIGDGADVPTTFSLDQNYPNPFNAKTNITFNLETESDVKISVFDITGAKVTTLVDARMVAGEHSVNWDASEIASGVYYYSLKTNGEESTRKMTLLK